MEEELKRYQAEMEKLRWISTWKLLLSGHIFEAEKVFKRFSFPNINLQLITNWKFHLRVVVSHTKRLDTVCVRKENVHHDVEGAYLKLFWRRTSSVLKSPEFTVGTKRISLTYKKQRNLSKKQTMRVLDLFELQRTD